MLAFVGAAPMVRIDWTPKAEGATGLAAMASVQAEQQVMDQRGRGPHQNHAHLFDQPRRIGPKLTIDVPADQKVVNVFDANVRKWSVETTKVGSESRPNCSSRPRASQQVTIELEKFIGDKVRDTIEMPSSRPWVWDNNSDSRGCWWSRSTEGLRAEAAKTSGLLQVDVEELPPALQREPSGPSPIATPRPTTSWP